MRIEIDRAARRMVVRRHSDADWLWWCQGDQRRNGNSLRWSDGTTLKVTTGKIVSLDPVGYQSEIRVGLGKLPLSDPASAKFPLATVHPVDGQIAIEVHPSSRDDTRPRGL